MNRPAALRVLSSGTADVSAIRTETFNGREYTVVPVVALVEGVIQGLNAENPEFAPASEFGKFPAGWDGRPLVLNHPEINGQLVSANSPAVLEDWAFGHIFNTQLDGTKLKTEAWIDNGRVAELGGEYLTTLERIQSGEETVEVSTGLFTEVTDTTGTYKSKKYLGSWQGVVPDHLAILTEGHIGACSVKDGCGIPRLNQGLRSSKPPHAHNHTHTNEGCGTCCDGCKSGGTCMSNGQPAAGVPTTQSQSQTQTQTSAEALVANTAEDSNTVEGGEGAPAEGTRTGEVDGSTPQQVEEIAQDAEAQGRLLESVRRLATNSVPGDMTLEDANRIIRAALRQHLNSYVYVVATTTEVVVYEGGDYNSGYYQLGYTLADNGTVTFIGVPVPVNLMTTIVPKSAAPAATVSANEGAQDTSGSHPVVNNSQEDGQMSGQTGSAPAEANAQNGAVNGGGQPTARTLEQYIGEAPQEIREMLESGLKMHSARKTALIKSLTENPRNKFTEQYLQGRSVEELENLAELADIKSFEGRALPTGSTSTTTVSANSAQASIDPAPRAFEAASQAATSGDAKAA